MVTANQDVSGAPQRESDKKSAIRGSEDRCVDCVVRIRVRESD
jgi:hypothetical protein